MNSSSFAALPVQSWADLVFHVLAHVESASELPSSVFDPAYVSFCEAELGSASERQLGPGLEALSALLTTEQAQLSVQRLAWLHDGITQGAASEGKPLAELASSEVASSALLAALTADAGDALHTLRSVVAAERPYYEGLPEAAISQPAQSELLRRVDELSPVAPLLTRARIVFVRALGRRGRVSGNEIWLGIPESANGTSVEHTAWQAAHQATVKEVTTAISGKQLGLGEREIEVAALVLLSRRAHAAGLAHGHARWFAALGMQVDPQAILEQARVELGSLLRRFGDAG